MKNNNIAAWNVLIYSLVLVNLALLLSLAMFNNFFVFLTNTEVGNIDKRLSNTILEKGALFAKYAKSVNSNGSGIIDNIGCPNNVSFSGTNVSGSSDSSLVYLSGAIYCGSVHNGEPYYIYFNPDFTWFSGAIYYWDIVNIDNSWEWIRAFIDSDSSVINISAGLPTSPDWVDDDFNSDNYSISATWSVYFPWNYVDDDALARTSIYWYISPQSEYSNILWSNTKTQNFITANPNNSDAYYDKIGTLNSWYLYLDADRDFDMKILQIDKNRYDTTNEFITISKEETAWIPASIGYIQTNSWTLSLTWVLTGNEYEFDFVANDYAIFLNNAWSGVLTYVLSAENASWSWVYINSIDDSGLASIKYLWAELIQDVEKNYIGKIFEVVSKK